MTNMSVTFSYKRSKCAKCVHSSQNPEFLNKNVDKSHRDIPEENPAVKFSLYVSLTHHAGVESQVKITTHHNTSVALT